MKKNKLAILIVVPAYNEEKNIENVVKNIVKRGYDYIVINDGSTDDTQGILIKRNIKHITLINNLGIGACVQTGYKYAYENNYDIAIQFDGDNQHDIKDIDKLIKPIMENNANMVIGSRFINKNSRGFKSTFARRIGINVISKVIKLKTKKTIYDVTSGFRAIDKTVLKEFSKFYPYEYPEPITNAIILKKGYTIKEIPVKMKPRLLGQSSIKAWKNLYYMINVILLILLIGKDNNE